MGGRERREKDLGEGSYLWGEVKKKNLFGKLLPLVEYHRLMAYTLIPLGG